MVSPDIHTQIKETYHAMDGQLTYLIEWLGQKAFNDNRLYPMDVKRKLDAMTDKEISNSQNPYLQAAAEAYNLEKKMKKAFSDYNGSHNPESLMATWKDQMTTSFKVIDQFTLDDLSRRIQNCMISIQNAYLRLENWLTTGSPQSLTVHRESSGSLVQKIESSFQETKSRLDSVKKQETEQRRKLEQEFEKRPRSPSPGNTGEDF